MKQKTLLKTFLTFMILALAFAYTLSTISSSSGKSVSSNVREVSPGESIQEAINNANPGDTIIVSQGTYKQWDIVVNKTLKIVGENPENTIIDGDGTARVIFQIVANDIVIENFTLQNTDTSFYVQGTAIRISDSINVHVSKVIAKNNYYGIELRSANFTKVTHCKISNNTWGIYIHDKSVNNTFSGNTITNNLIGVNIPDQTSQYNMFYHNNFINNTSSQVSSFSINYFDNGYPSGGNYWSDHIKTDLKHGIYRNESGSDGIVDEVYEVGAVDNYPLVHPIKILEIVVGEEKFEVEVSTNSSLNGCIFDSNAKSLKVYLEGEGDTNGSCRISIPKELLSCASPSEWTITSSNNGPLNYLTLEDLQWTYLYFTYNQSESFEIEIKGTNAIPEFPNTSTLLICAFGITIFLRILLKKKLISLQSGRWQ